MMTETSKASLARLPVTLGDIEAAAGVEAEPDVVVVGS